MTQPKSGANHGAPTGALAAALARLVTEGTLTVTQARAVTRQVRSELRRPHAPAPAAGPPPVEEGDGPSWSLLAAEVSAYSGGSVVLGAALVGGHAAWSHLAAPGRAALLAGPALLLSLAAVAIARTVPGGWQVRPDRDPEPGVSATRRIVGALGGLAAVLGGATAAVAADGLGQGGDRAALAFAGTAFLLAAAAYARCRSELLHTLLGLGAPALALTGLRASGWYGERSTGWVVVAVGAAWGAATLGHVLSERGLGFGWAAVLVFVGAELLTTTRPATAGYALLALLAAAGLVGYARSRSLTLLAVGAATLAVLVPQAIVA